MIFENILQYPNMDTKRVVIIGSGPAGISCAIELEKKKNPVYNIGSRRI